MILVVNTLVDVVGSATEGLALAFALGLLVLAPIDGLTGCDSDYSLKQRLWREGGILVAMLTLLVLGAPLPFGVGFVLGGPIAMSALQALYREMPQPAYTPVGRTH